MVAENSTATSLRLAKTMVFTERHGKLRSRRSVTFEPLAIKIMPRTHAYCDTTLSDLDKDLNINIKTRPGESFNESESLCRTAQ